MPASARQIEANRANAAHSTGPRTSQGKAASSQNAARHGLGAAAPFVLPGEQQDFASLTASLALACRPNGAVEELVFSRLVHAAWNLRRCDQLEYAAGPNEATSTVDRHAGRAERTLFRCLKELRTLQTERGVREAAAFGPLSAESMQAIPLASFAEMAKRTRPTSVSSNSATAFLQFEPGNTTAERNEANSAPPPPAFLQFEPGNVSAQPSVAAATLRHEHNTNSQFEPGNTTTQPNEANPPRPNTTTYRRDTPKVGRNEPCPCGSNIKYKRCCGK